MVIENYNALKEERELRKFYPEARETAVLKIQTKLDKHCVDFIARSPFLCIGSSQPNGCATVSPKGDAPGFVHVADDYTLLIPDRPGNNRLDTMRNIFHKPQVGLIFFIPGVEETLRVNGDARVIDDDEEMKRFEFKRHIPKVAIAVTVKEVFLHCGKALKRSKLWDEETKIERSSFTRAAVIYADHIKGASADEMEAKLEKSYRSELYK